MKNLISISIFAIALIISSCHKQSNSNINQTNNTLIQQGDWKITSYIDKGNDETNHYTNFVFRFGANGTVTAIKTSSTITGTWLTGIDDNQEKLVLYFTTSPFDELNADWHIISQSATQIKLEDVSGGGGGTAYLTFEKI
ncbi:MAG: hypothetical protein ABI851_11170 [Saprospiraceae bacterium]